MDSAVKPLDLRPLMIAYALCSMAMMAFVSLVGPIARELHLAEWQAGAAVSIAGALWMLCARPWGLASDRHGRRFVLLAGVSGFTLAYVLLVLGLSAALASPVSAMLVFALLVTGRGAMGAFFAAVPSVANALVADHVPPERRASAMATLGAANAGGIMFGPAIAALLARDSLTLPLFVTACLPAAALVLLLKYLPRDLHAPRPVAAVTAPRLLDPRLRLAMTVAFLAMFCVAIAQITVGFYALDALGLDTHAAARAAGIALTVVGIALIFSQLAVRKLGWAPQRLIAIGAVGGAIGFALCALAAHTSVLWLAYFIAAAGMGFVFPAFSALAANAVSANEQGAAAGSVGAAQGLGMVLGPVVGTVVYSLSPHLPYALCAALLLALAVGVGRLALRPSQDPLA